VTRRGVLVAVVVAVVAGCHGGNDWHPNAPFAPSLRPAFGARVTDGKLQIWTGSRCTGVKRLALAFEPNRAELVLTSEPGADVEHLTLGGQYPGMQVSHPLPDGFDWHNEESMRISIYGGPGGGGLGSSTDLTEVIEGSEQHPVDTYWFQGVGWLDPADVAAKDGKTFLATCTPDPAKKR
jgi:hypothetical protein